MTRVTSGYYDDRYYLEISGHACREEDGAYRMPSETDGEAAIACAAVSILVMTALERVRDLDGEGAFRNASVTVETGYACFDLEVREEYAEEIKHIFDIITLGFELLEENCPGLVCVA